MSKGETSSANVEVDGNLIAAITALGKSKGNVDVKRAVVASVKNQYKDVDFFVLKSGRVRWKKIGKKSRMSETYADAVRRQRVVSEQLEVGIAALEKQLYEHDKIPQSIIDKIESDTISDSDRDRIERVLRYARLKKKFVNENPTMNLYQTAEFLGLSKSNTTRLKEKLVSMGVIMLKYDGKLYVPAFQFSDKMDTFPQIKGLIEEISKRPMDVVGVCQFLLTPTSTQIRPFDFDDDIDLDDIDAMAKEKDMVFDGRPMDLLLEGKDDVFEVVKNAWLNHTNYALLNLS